jgi:hypothetical protein
VAENQSQLSFEQPRSAFGTWLGVVLLFAVFGLFVWVVVGAMPRGDDYESKRAKARVEKLKAASDEANTSLHGYGWVDKEKGIARLPIQRAMELTVVELAGKKPMAANPIATSDAQPGAQTSAPVGPSAAPTVQPKAEASTSPKAISPEGKDSENRGQPAAANNPPGARPGTQPGANATPAATPPAPASKPHPGPGGPTATPVQSAPGRPIPVPGKTP